MDRLRQFLQLYKLPLAFALLCAILYWIFAYQLVRSDFLKLISLCTGLFIITHQLIKQYGWNFWLLAALGVVFRLIFFFAIPNLSQDFYRFLWDGRLIAQGVTPYLFTPEQLLTNVLPKEILSQWASIYIPQAEILYQGMGTLNGSNFSNYPPINQFFFAVAALFAGKSILGSVVVLRTIIILSDIGILYFGKKLLEHIKLPTKNIFWYFLNPFIIIEMTGNLHFESVMLFFIVWAFYLLVKRQWFWAAVLWGISISVKLIPLLLLPLFFNYFTKSTKFTQGFWRLTKFYGVVLGTVALTFVFFISESFAQNFASSIGLWFQKFEFNASVYYIIRWVGYRTIGWNIIGTVGKILPLVVIFGLLLFTFFRKNYTLQQLITGMLFGITLYFLLATTVHPWYVASPLLLSVFTRYKFPIVWSALVMFSYSAYGSEGFSENLWWVALEYIILLWVIIYELRPTASLKQRILH